MKEWIDPTKVDVKRESGGGLDSTVRLKVKGSVSQTYRAERK